MSEKRVLVPVAPGTEEMEAVIIIDVLRRAGIAVTVASCCPDRKMTITASRGVHLTADVLIDDCADRIYDVIALPGGMPGAEHLRDNHILPVLLQKHAQQGRWLAAICAAPAVVLQHLNLLENSEVTCHPAFQSRLSPAFCRGDKPVVIDSGARRITSQAPGTAMMFALALVELLAGSQAAAGIAAPMVADYQPFGITDNNLAETAG